MTLDKLTNIKYSLQFIFLLSAFDIIWSYIDVFSEYIRIYLANVDKSCKRGEEVYTVNLSYPSETANRYLNPGTRTFADTPYRFVRSNVMTH